MKINSIIIIIIISRYHDVPDHVQSSGYEMMGTSPIYFILHLQVLNHFEAQNITMTFSLHVPTRKSMYQMIH